MRTMLSDRASRRIRAVWPLVSLVAIVNVLVLLASASGSAAWRTTTTAMLISVVMVVGLYTFVGLSGVMSFGHVGFMAIGAYVTAWLTMPEALKTSLLPELPGLIARANVPDVPAILVAGLVAALVGLLVAIPLMRLSGIQAGIGTLALLVIVYVVVGNADAYTRGQLTLVGVPLDTTISRAGWWATAAIAVAFVFQSSGLGARLRASREDAVAAAAVGVDVRRERRIAFVLSAFVVGAAGGVYAQFLGSLNPDAFYLELTVITVAMLVIGGVNSLSGAVVGTVVVSLFTEVLRRFESDGLHVGDLAITAPSGMQQVGLALLLLAMLILRPSGLTGGREIEWPWSRMARTADASNGRRDD